MSCNGCRVLRKGCSDGCMLRQCLCLIESPQAQSHATLFVAKFFGRAALMSFVSAVPDPHRPALFQSLLFEAVGRTINPVGGAVGLMWTGNWRLCQSAVDTVLRGGALYPLPDPVDAVPSFDLDRSSASEVDHFRPPSPPSPPPSPRDEPTKIEEIRLDLSLTSSPISRRKRPASHSEEEESETRTTWRSGSSESEFQRREAKLLRLFV